MSANDPKRTFGLSVACHFSLAVRSQSASLYPLHRCVLWGQMQRRQFITLLGGAAVSWPLAAHAKQTGKFYRVGFLWDGPDVFPDALEAFRQGLRELGYVEGRTIAIEYRWAEGKPERMRELAEELVRRTITRLRTGYRERLA